MDGRIIVIGLLLSGCGTAPADITLPQSSSSQSLTVGTQSQNAAGSTPIDNSNCAWSKMIYHDWICHWSVSPTIGVISEDHLHRTGFNSDGTGDFEYYRRAPDQNHMNDLIFATTWTYSTTEQCTLNVTVEDDVSGVPLPQYYRFTDPVVQADQYGFQELKSFVIKDFLGGDNVVTACEPFRAGMVNNL